MAVSGNFRVDTETFSGDTDFMRIGNDWMITEPVAVRDTMRGAALALQNSGRTQLVHHHKSGESCRGQTHVWVRRASADEPDAVTGSG